LVLVAAVLASLALAATEPTAFAVTPTHHRISTHADSTGPIVVNSRGVGYVAWDKLATDGNGDPVMFCRIPRGGRCTRPMALPLPAAAHWDSYDVIQPFPILGGAANVVLVVAPSYVNDDVVVWTSHNRGTSFSALRVIPSPSYVGNTVVDDIHRAPNNATDALNYFSIASHNTGLGYSYTGVGAIGAMHPPSGFKFDTDSIRGAVAGSTMSFSKRQVIEAFWTDATTPRLAYFWSPQAGVSGSPGTAEHGPYQIADGSNARLANGPKGLFLLSEDAGSSAAKPLRLHVRKWDHATHKFGPATLVGTVPNDANASNQGGFTEDRTTGELIVAWPDYGPGHKYEMRMWTSATGGASFSSPTTASQIGAGYVGPARLAATGTTGFLTFQNRAGLELIDLAHL
jgi:hypothetical protein